MRSSRRGRSGPGRRWGAPCWIAVGLVLTALASAPVSASAEVPPAFCKVRYARDYGAPLRTLPRRHPLPEGELPFGPRNLSAYLPEGSNVVLQGSSLGYRLGSKNSGYRVLHLNWDVRATLREVDTEGRVERIVATRHRKLGNVKDPSRLWFEFPAGRPGLFRIDIRFARLGGGRLGAYRDYFRVLRRSVDARLVANAGSFQPGETAYGTVENLGASRVIAPVYLEVERLEGGSWVAVPQPPTPDSIMQTSWWLDAGEVSRCHGFEIPADAAPGSYRFTVSPYFVQLQKRRALYAPFTVEP